MRAEIVLKWFYFTCNHGITRTCLVGCLMFSCCWQFHNQFQWAVQRSHPAQSHNEVRAYLTCQWLFCIYGDNIIQVGLCYTHTHHVNLCLRPQCRQHVKHITCMTVVDSVGAVTCKMNIGWISHTSLLSNSLLIHLCLSTKFWELTGSGSGSAILVKFGRYAVLG